MITMRVVVKVRSEKQEEFLQAMASLKSDREQQVGLNKTTLYQDVDDQTGFSLVYEWERQEDFDLYLCSEKFSVLLGAIKVLSERSEIRYFCPKLLDPTQYSHEPMKRNMTHKQMNISNLCPMLNTFRGKAICDVFLFWIKGGSARRVWNVKFRLREAWTGVANPGDDSGLHF